MYACIKSVLLSTFFNIKVQNEKVIVSLCRSNYKKSKSEKVEKSRILT